MSPFLRAPSDAAAARFHGAGSFQSEVTHPESAVLGQVCRKSLSAPVRLEHGLVYVYEHRGRHGDLHMQTRGS